jgi:hypothetical protein
MAAYTKILLSSLLIYSCLSVPVSYSEVKKQLYVIGGGGEPDRDFTIFDDSLKQIANFSNTPGWDTTITFNGGHKKTEDIIKTKMKKAKNGGAFVKKSYNALIEDMIAKVKSSTKGDQFLLTIDSHGGEQKGEKTHSIAAAYSEAGDRRSLDGAETINLDRLEELAKLAGDRGVKLAIVDMSCFSGNLLNIKNDKVCMISATGPKHYGYAGDFTFAKKFYENFKPGKNLEDIFLETREFGHLPDFPMISTNAGRAVNDILYKSLTPYLNFNDEATSDFTLQYSAIDKKAFTGEVCMFDKNHDDMLAIVKQIRNVDKVATKVTLNRFTEAINKYRALQKKYEQSLLGKYEVEDEIKKILEKNFADKKDYWEKYSPIDFVGFDFATEVINAKKRLAVAESVADSERAKNHIKLFTEQDKVAKAIRAQLSSSAKNKLKQQDKMMKEVDQTWKLAQLVGLEARAVYNTLYKQQNTKKSNACKDFVL